ADGTWTLVVRDANPLFLRVASVVPAGGASSVAALDLDGDGKPDLVTTCFGGGAGTTLTVLRGLGSGAFGGRADYAAGNGPRALSIG
ncbi:hypothetical protein NL529_30785, partial [Klebsiella pneumoniae]|nr:hypothetical protein [Klebsiella pneumoniae]